MRRPLLAVALVLAAAGGGCRGDTVRLSFQPEAGARYRYEVEVESATRTEIADRPVRAGDDRFRLRADHRVLRSGPGGTEVEVRLRHEDGEVSSFVARLDRAAQLVAVETVEGIPAAVLGDLGISELLAVGAASLPDRGVEPGDRWPLRAAELRGEGRLVELGVVDGRDVATIETTYRVPVDRETDETAGRVRLVGTQTTTARTTHALADGAVERSTAVTRGRFRVTIRPPEGTEGPVLEGTLTLEVRSSTRRVS